MKALSALMVQIKAKFPDKTDSTVLAEPDTSYDTLVQVMDAMRESHTVAGAQGHARGTVPHHLDRRRARRQAK